MKREVVLDLSFHFYFCFLLARVSQVQFWGLKVREKPLLHLLIKQI